MEIEKKNEQPPCSHVKPGNILKNIRPDQNCYKDQCTKCFQEWHDEDGIDVCLKTLNGGCTRHAELYFSQKNWPLVMNIKAREKKKEGEDEGPKKITKLGIGVPGGAKMNLKEWDYFTQIKCLACKKDLDDSELTNDIKKKILQAKTSDVKAEMKSWEYKIKPCPCTTSLVQPDNVKIADMSMAKCQSCDLTQSSGLWLCLTCGALGCSRERYGGGGGNSHAVKHNEQNPSHSLVVKMGTITPEGEASIFCYKCNDDVLDEKLPEHLAQLGMDISGMEKTEKTMLEMNIDINNNFNLSRAFEKGRALTPVFGPCFTGMQNLGNTCYMNSVMQTLFSIPEFQFRYLKKGQLHLENCSKNAYDCFTCQISKLCHGLCSGQYSVKQKFKSIPQPKPEKPEREGQMEEEVKEEEEIRPEDEFYQDGIRPFMFRLLVGKDHAEFKTNKQQDASEYFHHIEVFLEKDAKKNSQVDLCQLLKFQTITKLVCTKCQKYSLKEMTTSELTVKPAPMPEGAEIGDEYPSDLFQMLKQYSSPKMVQNKQCYNCKEKTTYIYAQYVKTWPKYLLVNVDRLIAINWVPKKSNAYVNFPYNKPLSLEALSFPGVKEGEEELPGKEDEEEPEFEFNLEALAQLISMGFTENASKRALKQHNNDVNNAMNWIFSKTGDDSINLPLDDGKKSKGPKFNMEQVAQIQSMVGCSENAAKRGLLENNQDANAAVMWLFQKQGDPALDLPLEQPKDSKKKQKSNVDPAKIAQVTGMGFTEEQAIWGLGKTGEDVMRCVDYLFSHGGEMEADLKAQNQPKSEEQLQQEKDFGSVEGQPPYQLHASIVHLGKSAGAGHYICYCNKNGKWIYYNDRKVCISDKPEIEKGFMYIFKRLDA